LDNQQQSLLFEQGAGHRQQADHLGTANVTWITRWPDLAYRNEAWSRLWEIPEWNDIFSRVPEGMASYLRIEAKFADSLM
jgi:hypothetical protein